MSTTPVTAPAASPTRVRALAAAAAVVAAALIWIVARAVLDIDLRTPDGPGSTTTTALPFVNVVVATAVVSLLGWGLLTVLERFTSRARPVWSAAATAVLVLSLFAPLFAEGLTTGNRITLVLLHLTVGAILIPAFRREAAERPTHA
uniref:Uncharacterized protein sanU n=1 Tax=Streptomyces sp. SANK 61196 TaxID=764784 RepID=E2EKL6_9ACTN|nr:hypothetical protein [Streptomyces sp. SANK 61196]